MKIGIVIFCVIIVIFLIATHRIAYLLGKISSNNENMERLKRISAMLRRSK